MTQVYQSSQQNRSTVSFVSTAQCSFSFHMQKGAFTECYGYSSRKQPF